MEGWHLAEKGTSDDLNKVEKQIVVDDKRPIRGDVSIVPENGRDEKNELQQIADNQFHIAKPGEESDLIFGIEEATFENGVWIARGFVTGVLSLRAALPRSEKVHKGRVIALRFDPAEITLVSG